MPNYRRPCVPGCSVFLTLVTHKRRPLFANEAHIDLLRDAASQVRVERPFTIEGAVILPDHLHFVWRLPAGDDDFSRRVGRLKALFTKSLLERTPALATTQSISRMKHDEREIWQRRFWDHVCRDEDDWSLRMDYLHYNPVKHGLVACPHLWPHSTFHALVQRGLYSADWACSCNGRAIVVPDFSRIEDSVGE